MGRADCLAERASRRAALASQPGGKAIGAEKENVSVNDNVIFCLEAVAKRCFTNLPLSSLC